MKIGSEKQHGKPPVSVVINTLNEAARITNCLESVRWADEIVLVDMMSDDHTAEKALELGCAVYRHDRMGYVEPAREFAVSKTRNDWVLILDADETCSQGLRDWIVDKLAASDYAAVAIPRRNYMNGCWIRCCGWYPDRQVRLLRKSCATFSKEIHQSPRIDGRTLEIPASSTACIEHAAVVSMSERLAKLAIYSEISAQFAFEHGRTCSASMLLLRTLWAFVSSYLLRGGLFAGSLGLVLSLERANATFMKYVCLWDKTRTSSK